MDTEFYRKKAEEAHREAQAARTPEEKANWLELADKWLKLVGEAESAQLGPKARD